jgi:hypothetical protein
MHVISLYLVLHAYGATFDMTCVKKTYVPFGCADKPAEKHCWLNCCERKILFRLKKKQAEKDGL